MFDSLWPHWLQHARLSCPSPIPGSCSNPAYWVRDAIQPSHLLLSPSPPAFNLSHGHQWALKREGNISAKGCRCVTFFWLVGGEATERCSRNLVLSLKLPSYTLGERGSSAEELKDTVKHISWVEIRTLPQGCTIIWLPLLCFCIPSVPWSAIVWICPLGLRKGQGGWMKSTSYKQEMENIERIHTPESQRILLSFNSGNWATMTLITSCQNGAQGCLSLANRHWIRSIPEFWVLDLSPVWLKSQSLGLAFWCNTPS